MERVIPGLTLKKKVLELEGFPKDSIGSRLILAEPGELVVEKQTDCFFVGDESVLQIRVYALLLAELIDAFSKLENDPDIKYVLEYRIVQKVVTMRLSRPSWGCLLLTLAGSTHRPERQAIAGVSSADS